MGLVLEAACFFVYNSSYPFLCAPVPHSTSTTLPILFKSVRHRLRLNFFNQNQNTLFHPYKIYDAITLPPLFNRRHSANSLTSPSRPEIPSHFAGVCRKKNTRVVFFFLVFQASDFEFVAFLLERDAALKEVEANKVLISDLEKQIEESQVTDNSIEIKSKDVVSTMTIPPKSKSRNNGEPSIVQNHATSSSNIVQNQATHVSFGTTMTAPSNSKSKKITEPIIVQNQTISSSTALQKATHDSFGTSVKFIVGVALVSVTIGIVLGKLY